MSKNGKLSMKRVHSENNSPQKESFKEPRKYHRKAMTSLKLEPI